MTPATIRDPYKLVNTMLGRYLVLEAVGSGGMGIVYRAQHELTKAEVAIKVLRPENSGPEDLQRFLREAEQTARLAHPAIVKIFSADLINNDAFLVMEWLEGRTLDAELKERGRLPLARVVALLEQVCAGVAYAHSRGIIHRDLKPANLMLVTDEDGNEVIRILDFGIAKALNATHSYNTKSIGTIYYASPEQLRAGAKIDHRADIYSLGAILYQLLTGRPPFDADSALAVMDMHRGAAPPPLRQFNPDITPALEEVVLRALAKQPAERQQTATELAQALRLAAHIQNSTLIVCAQDAVSAAAAPGAAVYVNGKFAGLTNEHGNLFLEQLPPRQYLLEVVMPRYDRWHRSVGLEPSEELEVAAKLQRAALGDLVLVCNVPGAAVEVDGVNKGVTNETGRLHLESLAAGEHRLRLTHPDCLPVEAVAQIGTWEQELAEVTLEPRPPNALRAGWQRFSGALRAKREHQTAPLALPEGSPAPPKLLQGAAATQPCPRCGERVPAELKFCVECGAALQEPVTSPQQYVTRPELVIERQCDQCGTMLPLDARQCPVCESARATAGLRRRPVWRQVLTAVLLLSLLTVAGLLYAKHAGWFTRPAPLRTTLVIEPPDSAVTIDERRVNAASGQLDLAKLELADGAHQLVVVSKPCYRESLNFDWPLKLPLPEKIQLQIVADMACVPGGTFTMGREGGPPEEGPPHEVTVAPFLMDKTEVTVEQYQQFLAAKPDYPAPRGWKGARELSAAEANLPATGVTWNEASDYAQWAGKELPTEAEWEFAARNGSKGSLYPWGEGVPTQANANVWGGGIKPVTDFAAGRNEWDVLNLIGNVWEWTNDDCHEYAGANPFCPLGYGALKIIRGGAFSDDDATATMRRAWPATWSDWGREEVVGYESTGFRCVRRVH